jgi:predicted 3-demethylubiquinone-9 3-methyltransferase (glyoxalase superfamily)
MQLITPFLWYDDDAEQAVEFYLTLFEGSVIDVNRAPDGRAFVIRWQMGGSEYLALNGGPHYAQTPAFSLQVDAGEQDNVDRLWEALTADGGEESQCGWLVDKFGVSWQIVPTRFAEIMSGPNAAAANAALMSMTKIDIAALEAASLA